MRPAPANVQTHAGMLHRSAWTARRKWTRARWGSFARRVLARGGPRGLTAKPGASDVVPGGRRKSAARRARDSRSSTANREPRTANREPRTANREPRAAYRKGHAAIKCQPPDADDAPNMPNAKRQTPNAKRQTPNAKRQTPNAKRQTALATERRRSGRASPPPRRWSRGVNSRG
ncbi:hypothetical protein C7S16_2364 [Burkholderia thailandensis]|uniref:Uncharacterized protein n=1 Tax=Burkholderia thailandensis TaxID=57975 RepID=A0AAW9CYZ1_BURTH|nr:hypothetical protein [Burkholderia thailandensis]